MTYDKIPFLEFPAEILLHILSYLDLPDLAILAQVAPVLKKLTADPVLHSNRIRIISPSRLNHYLFATDAKGRALRPTVGDLVQRGVMRGLNIERRWRMGTYFYSKGSIIQYENGLKLARQHACHVLSLQLNRRLLRSRGELKSLYSCTSSVFPDVESSSPNVARALLPIMRKLKWSFKCDELAKRLKVGARGGAGFAFWLEHRGRGVVRDDTTVRLAICPDMRKLVEVYERLGFNA